MLRVIVLSVFLTIIFGITDSYAIKPTAPVYGEIKILSVENNEIEILFAVVLESDFEKPFLSVKLPENVKLLGGDISKEFRNVKKGEELKIVFRIKDLNTLNKNIIGTVRLIDTPELALAKAFVLELNKDSKVEEGSSNVLNTESISVEMVPALNIRSMDR